MKLKPIKRILSLATVALMLAGGLFLGTHAQADRVAFNQMQGDQEFTQARTDNMQNYADPLNATVNDRITVAVYFHNNDVSVPATGVRISSIIPTTVSTSHVIKTTLSADNADSITDTVVNGQIVGSPDLTINSDQPAQLHYVEGSTKLYSDLKQNPNEPGVTLPDGVATPQGVLLGDGVVQACWAHAGYLTYQMTFNQTPQLETDKWVSLYGGNNQWVKENTAKAGDTLTYQILFGNKGNGVATNAKIVDQLPAGLTVDQASFSKRILVNGQDTDVNIPASQVTFAGQTITVPLGDIKSGQDNSGYLYFHAKVNSNLSVGDHVLVNNEDLKADNAPTVSGSAKTTVTVSPALTPDVKILKEVVNVTQGAQNWVKENTAKPGDTLQYRLTISNDGTAPATAITVKDTLPQYVSYVAGSSKIFTTDPNSGQAIADGVTAGGISVPNIQNGVPQGNRYITFNVKVTTNVPAGNIDLINKADVFMSGALKGSDTAKTTLTSETGMLLTKEVWNPSTGQWVTHLDGVTPSQDVIFRIVVRNTGSAQINNIVIKDILPTDGIASLVAGSSREDGVQINDNWITTGAGLLIANQPAGGIKTLTFTMHVGACPQGGTHTVVNTATVTADGMPQKTATAEFVVTAGPPSVPKF